MGFNIFQKASLCAKALVSFQCMRIQNSLALLEVLNFKKISEVSTAMQLPDAQGVTLEPWDIGLNQVSKLQLFLPDSRAPRNPKGVFFTCSMSQHRPLGWLGPLTAWLCNRQLRKLAALGTLFGREDPEVPAESWLNTRISGSVMVIKYPCFTTVIWRRGKRSGGFIWFLGNCGASLLTANLGSTKHWPAQPCTVLCKDHLCPGTNCWTPAAPCICSILQLLRQEIRISRL